LSVYGSDPVIYNLAARRLSKILLTILYFYRCKYYNFAYEWIDLLAEDR